MPAPPFNGVFSVMAADRPNEDVALYVRNDASGNPTQANVDRDSELRVLGSIQGTGNGTLSSPVILSQSGSPVILSSSAAAITADGAVTGATALPYVPSGVVQVFMALAGMGGVTGLYYAVYSLATAFQLYLNAAGTIKPAGLTVGAYAGTTAEATLATVVLPGGMMGANGKIRATLLDSHPNNGNNKTLRARYSTAALTAPAFTSTVSGRAVGEIQNRGITNSQVSQVALINPGGSTATANTYSAIDSTINQNITLTGQLANAADFIVLEAYSIEVLPMN